MPRAFVQSSHADMGVHVLRATAFVLATSALWVAPSPCVAADETSGGLSLEEVLARAAAERPDLQAASLRADAVAAHARQSGLPLNPTLSVEVENFIGSGDFEKADVAETTVYLTQPIEWWGKRGKRGRVGSMDAEIALAETEILAAQVRAEVSAAFAGVLAAQDRLALSERLAQGLARSGKQGHADRLESAHSDARSERALLASARAQLALASGIDLEALPPVRGDLEETPSPPELESLLAAKPNVVMTSKWNAALGRRQAELDRQLSRRVPDVQVSAGYRRFNETDEGAAIFYLSLPIPLFDRNQGAVDAASYELAEGRALRRSAERHWQAELLDTHRALVTSFRAIGDFRDRLLPEANEKATAASQADAQLAEARLRRDYIDALERYHRHWAELNRLTARSERVSSAE